MEKTLARAAAAALLFAPAALLADAGLPTIAHADMQMRDARIAFAVRCGGCHSQGAGVVVGPDLAGVTLRRTDDWLARWLHAPEIMARTDEPARALVVQYGREMPNPQLSDADVRAFIRYFHWFDDRPAAARAP